MDFGEGKSQSQKVRAVRAEVQDLDAGAVWLRAMISSVIKDPMEAERVFRQVPALVGLMVFKEAMARADRTIH